MRPKHSTGYLTPQAAKKLISKPRRTGSNETLNTGTHKDLNDGFFEKLMSDPIKRQLVLSLINSEKDNIEAYKRNQLKEQKIKEINASPISKVKRNFLCESPTALLRRRALEQQNQGNTSENQNQNWSGSSSRSSSRQSNASNCQSPVPFNKLLDGIIAYVEINCKDKDKSGGVKMLVNTMGATVRDKFTKDVTHVIFKDGSFITYQKAKLMKVHLVSILWVEAVRINNMRVPENKFPALGTECYDNNVSTICSQLQKDYEEIIRDELHRSLTTGTPLPSTQTFIDKRRTIMTPSASSSHIFSQEFASSQDREVESILHSRRKTYNFSRNESPFTSKLSPELTSDDSDSGPVIDGVILKRKDNSNIPNLSKSNRKSNVLKKLDDSNMDLTFLCKSTPLPINKRAERRSNVHISVLGDGMMSGSSKRDATKENYIPNIPNESIYNKKTPKIKKNKIRETSSLKEVICTDPDDSLCRRKTEELSVTNTDTTSSTNKPVLEVSLKSSGIQILSKNVGRTSGNIVKDTDNIQQTTLCNETCQKSSSTNMSSLKILSDVAKPTLSKENEDVSASTNMSSLLITSNSTKDSVSDRKKINNNVELNLKKESSGSKRNSEGKESFSPLDSSVVNDLVKLLDSPHYKDENVTTRRKNNLSEQEKVYNTRSVRSLNRNKSKSDEICLEINSSFCNSNNDRVLPKHRINKELSKNDSLSKKTKRRRENNSQNAELIQLNGLVTDLHITPENENRKGKSYMNKNSTSGERTSNIHVTSDTSPDATESSGSDKKVNKMRKLYNPDESIKQNVVNDESERECKRNEVKKRRSNEGVVLNPNIVPVSPNTLVTANAKKFVDENELNLNAILNKDSEESENDVKLPKRRKTKKNEIKRNTEDDEQHQLAAEFLNNKSPKKNTTKEIDTIKRRKSARLSQRRKKKLNLDTSMSGSDEKDIVIATSLANRKSTMEFQTKSQINLKKLKIDKAKRPSIVCTKLHKEDIQIFNQIVRKLGGFVIEDEVSDKTTHLVAGEPKRTINMLRAMAMGCWILKHEWLLRSLEERKWLPEEDYEETDFSPAVQQCRLQRQSFGPSYTMDVFQDCGPIYIGKGTTPRSSDLKDLVSLCKGNICTIPRNSAIVVGEYVRYEEVKCVTEAWVLDSITFNKRRPLKKYIITPSNCSPVV